MLRARSAKMKRAPAPPPSRRHLSLPSGHCFGNGSLHDGPPAPIMTAQPLGDECAINELLEGRMDLDVHLPGEKTVRMTVERRTPMMDLLIQVTTANKINPGGHVIQLLTDRGRDSVHYKPSTPIGSLDTNTIYIVPKSLTSDAPVKKMQKVANQPFEQTFRLQVNLPRNQLMVIRVSPRMTLAEVKHTICSEKNLEEGRYHLVHPSKPDAVLDLNNTLAGYGFNEISLLSNKSVTANIRNYQTDLIAYSAREDGVRRRGLMSLFSRSKKSKAGSTGDSSSDGIDSRGESPCRSDNSGNQGNQNPPAIPGKAAPKKRPAPPPPSKPATLQIEVASNETTNSGSNSALDGGGTIYHSRHSSDSSGYHEASVLSESPDSLSPETSCGSGSSGLASMDSPVHSTPVEKTAASKKDQSSSAASKGAEVSKEKLNRQSSHMSHVSTMSKKRKAPPPPPSAAVNASACPSSGAEVSKTTSPSPPPLQQAPLNSSELVSEQTAATSSSVSVRSTESVAAPVSDGTCRTPAQDVEAKTIKSIVSDGDSISHVSSVLHTTSTTVSSHSTVKKDDEIPTTELAYPSSSPNDESYHELDEPEASEDRTHSSLEASPSPSVEPPSDQPSLVSQPSASPPPPEVDNVEDVECVDEVDNVAVFDTTERVFLSDSETGPRETIHRTSLSSTEMAEDLERDFQQTISEAEQAVIKEELQKISSFPVDDCEDPPRERKNKVKMADASAKVERDLTQQEILSHIEAAFSVVECEESPSEMGDVSWDYPVPEPPSPFRGNGEALPDFPESPTEPEKEASVREVSKSNDDKSLTSKVIVKSAEVQCVNSDSEKQAVHASNAEQRARHDSAGVVKDVETVKSVQRSNSTLPRRPLMNFSIGTYKKTSAPDDMFSAPDAVQGDVDSGKSMDSLSRSSTLKKNGGFGGPGVRIGSFQERNRTIVIDDKLYDPEGAVRGIRGKVQTLKAEMKSMPMLNGRSASLMNLTDSKRITLDNSVKNVTEVNGKNVELKKTSSEIRLNGVSTEPVENGVDDEENLQEEYSKLQNQFLVWQKQLEHNQALLKKQKIDVSAKPTLSGIRPVSVKEAAPESQSQPLPPVPNQKAQTLPRPKHRPLSVVEVEQRTATLGRQQRPKSQVLANVTIGSWQQRSRHNNSLTDLLAKFESIENFESQNSEEKPAAMPLKSPVENKTNSINGGPSQPPARQNSLQNGSLKQSKISVKIGVNNNDGYGTVRSPGSSIPHQTVINELNGVIQSSKHIPTKSSAAGKPAPKPPVPEKNITTVTISQRPQSPLASWKPKSPQSPVASWQPKGFGRSNIVPVVKGFSLKQQPVDSSTVNGSAPESPQSPKVVSSDVDGVKPSVVSVKPRVSVPNGLPKAPKPERTTGSMESALKKSTAPAPPPPPPPPSSDQSHVPKSSISSPPPPPPPEPKDLTKPALLKKSSKGPGKSSKPPVPQLDPREELMLEIRNFTASGALRKVPSNQSKWQLQVFGSSVTTS